LTVAAVGQNGLVSICVSLREQLAGQAELIHAAVFMSQGVGTSAFHNLAVEIERRNDSESGW